MNRTQRELLVKFVMTYIFTVLALQAPTANPGHWILVLSLAVTAVNYMIGDIIVLPGFGNTVASAGDGLMAALAGHIARVVIPVFSTSLAALLFYGLLIGIGEFFFHKHVIGTKKINP